MERKTYIFSMSLPPARLHPNKLARNIMHRNRLKKERQAQMSRLFLVATNFDRPKYKKVRLELDFYIWNSRRDVDNMIAWLKADIDALQIADVVENDNGVELAAPKMIVIDKSESQFYIMRVVPL